MPYGNAHGIRYPSQSLNLKYNSVMSLMAMQTAEHGTEAGDSTRSIKINSNEVTIRLREAACSALMKYIYSTQPGQAAGPAVCYAGGRRTPSESATRGSHFHHTLITSVMRSL